MLEIKKIATAAFFWMALYAKNLAKVSILPVIMMAPFLFSLWSIMQQVIAQQGGEIDPQIVPASLLFSLLIAVIGYAMLSINIYRMVILGVDTVKPYALKMPAQMWQFIATLSIIQGLLSFPVLLLKTPLIYLFVYFLIVPMVMSLPRMALNLSKKRHNISGKLRLQLTALLALAPLSVVLFISWLMPENTLGIAIVLLTKVLVAFWELVALAMVYKSLFSIKESTDKGSSKEQ